MSSQQRKTAPSAQTPGAEEDKRYDYPAETTFTVEAVANAMRYAHEQLRDAGDRLVHGDLPACKLALRATQRAVGAALDSLAGLAEAT